MEEKRPSGIAGWQLNLVADRVWDKAKDHIFHPYQKR
jgi:hypothetical protein